MSQQPIAVLDSGVGGLPYLAWIRDQLPQESLIYLADRRHFPYGEKSNSEIQKAVTTAVEVLRQRVNPKILVIACNTASVVALDSLRQTFTDLPIVGVVPAIKVAAQRTRNGRIGVLATRRTIEDGYWQYLASEFCQGQTVIPLAAADIVEHVENDFLNPQPQLRQTLMAAWSRRIHEQELDTLVLGCTHFLHLLPDFTAALGPGVELVDSRDGVARQTARQLLATGSAPAGQSATVDFVFTADPAWTEAYHDQQAEKYRVFATRFGLTYGGSWTWPE